jgi:sec-independent protein translocase protein TatB
MFDVGLQELILIMVIALLVVGPKRLPGLARKAGFWLGRARSYIAGVRNDIAEELRAEELRDMMTRQEQEMRELRSMLDQTKSEMHGGLEIEQEHLLKAIDEQPGKEQEVKPETTATGPAANDQKGHSN